MPLASERVDLQQGGAPSRASNISAGRRARSTARCSPRGGTPGGTPARLVPLNDDMSMGRALAQELLGTGVLAGNMDAGVYRSPEELLESGEISIESYRVRIAASLGTEAAAPAAGKLTQARSHGTIRQHGAATPPRRASFAAPEPDAGAVADTMPSSPEMLQARHRAMTFDDNEREVSRMRRQEAAIQEQLCDVASRTLPLQLAPRVPLAPRAPLALPLSDVAWCICVPLTAERPRRWYCRRCCSS